MIKIKRYLILWTLLLCVSPLAIAEENIIEQLDKPLENIPKRHMFYLSYDGSLVEFDINDMSETAKLTESFLPTKPTVCNQKIYFGNFIDDTLYMYDPALKDLKKKKLFLSPQTKTVIVYKDSSTEIPKSWMRRSVETFPITRRFVKKKKETEVNDSVIDQLPSSGHNTRLGISDLICNNNKIFVTSATQGRIDILNSADLTYINSLYVGERPGGISVSPNNKYLAVASTAYNKIYILSTSDYHIIHTIDTKDGITKIDWIDNDSLVLLSRAENSISMLSPSRGQKYDIKIDAEDMLNNFIIHPESKKIYALSGSQNKILVIDPKTRLYIETSFDNMDFASSLYFYDTNQLVLSSSKSNKILVLNLQDATQNIKFQTNLRPKELTGVYY